jgi:hypothetical protein
MSCRAVALVQIMGTNFFVFYKTESGKLESLQRLAKWQLPHIAPGARALYLNVVLTEMNITTEGKVFRGTGYKMALEDGLRSRGSVFVTDAGAVRPAAFVFGVPDLQTATWASLITPKRAPVGTVYVCWLPEATSDNPSGLH